MSFGEILKQHRLEHGWTKEYVAEHTHMMTRIIDALETETLKKIPAPIYGRGFIRRYCDLLGIEPQPLIDDYMTLTTGTVGKAMPVTRPAVRELPARPPEPIHTGARRTLPPTEPLPITPPEKTVHKLVEPAEESFTAVPKPEDRTIEPEVIPVVPEPRINVAPPAPSMPEAPAPAPKVTPSPTTEGLDLFQHSAAPIQPAAAPAEKDAFNLAGDTLPLGDTPQQPTPPVAHPHRAIFAKSFEQEKRERTIVKQRDRSDELQQPTQNKRNIFSPQQPVKEPTPSIFRPLVDLLKQFGGACKGVVTRATRPKVKRMKGNEGRYITPRMLYQALLVFLLLLGMTGLLFAFRYVFRLSDAAETEYGVLPEATSTQFELRQVATPPDAFFD